MELNQQIEEVVKNHFVDERFFVVQVKATLSKIRSKVTVLVDTDEGITIDELGKLSRSLDTELDTLIPSAFTLEVSSPGVDFPLSMPRQFKKNVGRDIQVTLQDGNLAEGTLSEVKEEGVILTPKKKKKKEEPTPLEIPFEQIKLAKVVISFK